MTFSHDEQAIIAQCTPKGSGAIALLRISGLNAFDIATAISKLASQKLLHQVPTHTIHFGWIVDPDGTHIDQVLFLLMHGPRTFTGQHTVEITCHNNPFIIAKIIEVALKAGARMADNGEFSRRAVINGKIDLVQAEAINDLIHAQTSVTLKQSMAQLEGSLSCWIGQLEESLLQALALTEASFEFLDDEISFGSQIKEIITRAREHINRACASFDQQQQIRNGIKIALVGSVNAGKSSLFNALLAKERAIVTDIPGTTRDTIEAGLYKDGNYWTLIDTAGIRKTHDLIEQQGIGRSLKEAHMADIVVLVLDGTRALEEDELQFYRQCMSDYKEKIILVRNKCDAVLDNSPVFYDMPVLECSCVTKYNIDLIEQKIKEKISDLFNAINSPFLLNERQAHTLVTIDKNLVTIDSMLIEPIHYELVATHLKDTLSLTADLTGKTLSEKSMDLIFKQFCVGK